MDKKNLEAVVPAMHGRQLVQSNVVAAFAGTVLFRVNFVDFSKSFVYLLNFSQLFFCCAVVPWFPLAGECYELECFKTQ